MMRARALRRLLQASAAVAALAGAPAGATDLEPMPGAFQEGFHLATLAPSQVQGLRYGATDSPIDPDATRFEPSYIQFLVERYAGQMLCVTLNSVDKRYWAKAAYKIPEQVSGWTRAVLPTSYSAEIRAYKLSEIAVFAEIRRDCARPTRLAVVPAALYTARPTQVVVYVSAGDARSWIEAPRRQGGMTRYGCTQLPQTGEVRTFDQECRLPLSRDLDLSKAQLFRQRVSGRGEPLATSLPIGAP